MFLCKLVVPTCMFPCKLGPTPLHHNGKGSAMVYCVLRLGSTACQGMRMPLHKSCHQLHMSHQVSGQRSPRDGIDVLETSWHCFHLMFVQRDFLPLCCNGGKEGTKMKKLYGNVHFFLLLSCIKTCTFSSSFYPPITSYGKGSIPDVE